MSHPWAQFSEPIIDQLADAISPNAQLPRWRLISESGFAARDFEMYGAASFRVSNIYNLCFASKILMLGNQERWLASLSDRAVRQTFLEVCRRVAGITGAKELLLLPEGTILNDLLYDRIGFDGLKNRAEDVWGKADLDIHRIYSESEVRRFEVDRIHYFLTKGI